MNILLLHHYALPPSGAGGTRHFTLAQHLVKRGHSVTIIASRHAYTGAGTVSDNTEDTFDGVRFIWLEAGGRGQGMGGRGLGMLKFARAAYKKALEMSGGWDVIMGTSPQPFSAFAASRIAHRLRLPFVLEIRDLWPLSARDLAGWKDWNLGWLALRQLEKYLYRSADHILTLLPGSQDWMIASGAQAKNITVVPNGVDVQAKSIPLPAPVNDKFTCVYAGAHGVANGLDTVVRAAALLAQMPGGENIRVRLIGNGPTKPALLELAKELDAHQLEFKDPVPKSQVAEELAAANVCILHLKRMPTFAYGVSPNKLFDYFMAARPVIYGVEAANDPVSDAEAGVTIPSENAKALAVAMIRLSQMQPSERQEMGERGHRYVVENHDWSVFALRIEEILNDVVMQK